MSQILRGKVTAYPDGKNKGLIEVSIGAYEQKQDKVFARVTQSVDGMYWLPEIGTVVEVETSEEIGHEVRMVGVYRKEDDAQVSKCWTEKNDTKQWKTRSGHTVTLSDTQDETVVSIVTAGGLEFKLDDGKKQISVKPKDAKTPSVLLDTDTQKDTITLSAGKGIQIHCGKAKIEIDSSGNITISTSGKLNLSAQNISLDAKGKLSATGGQSAELSGKMTATVSGQTKLDLTSSGITQVKGSLVKLN